MKKLIWTYRKWNDWQICYIDSYTDEGSLYCESPYYEDSWCFEADFILENSVEANIDDILQYKKDLLKFNK